MQPFYYLSYEHYDDSSFLLLQYREDITKLNELAKHRPKSTLLLGSKEESTRIAELQQENIDLQTTLEDHQSALELIMSKYREHVSWFKVAFKMIFRLEKLV